MGRLYDIITFDCYGTLIDWEGGITGAFIDRAARDGLVLGRDAIIDAYHSVEPEVESETYRSYREVLTETAFRVARKVGWKLANADAGFLAESLPRWKPFPDTNPALERLVASGHALAILSNVDDALIAETMRHFTVGFDFVVTAQQVRSYKPAHPHFEKGREKTSGRRWLHAAQSYFHDVVPARDLGIPVAWVNRKGEPSSGETKPDRELRTLTELAEWLSR